MTIIDDGQPIEDYYAQYIEFSGKQSLDGMFAKWDAAHPSSLNPDIPFPDGHEEFGTGLTSSPGMFYSQWAAENIR
jgi:hypothetical protein